MIPYKRRKLRLDEPVWVYRNLNRPKHRTGVWYSLMQRGRVVAHAREVTLVDVKFVVREAGRQRVLATGRKNVHAFVVGKIGKGHASCAARRARYNPRESATFTDQSWDASFGSPVKIASRAYLDSTGVRFIP